MTRRRVAIIATLVAVVFGISTKLFFDYRYTVAREILGRDFIPPEEFSKQGGLPYTAKQRLAFRLTLPPRDVLQWCHENDYVVVAGPNRPMSLLEVEGSFSSYFYDISRVPPGSWVHENWLHSPDEKVVQNEKVETVWILVRKTAVPGSENQTWQDQVKLLSSVERVPRAVEVSWAVMVYKFVHDENLFEKGFVRTSTISADGLHVNVGGFGQYGFTVNNDYDDCTEPNYGISAARKAY
jgi:hypothetical protein